MEEKKGLLVNLSNSPKLSHKISMGRLIEEILYSFRENRITNAKIAPTKYPFLLNKN